MTSPTPAPEGTTPAFYLAQLLKMPPASRSDNFTPEEEVRVAELLMIIVDMQAQWLEKGFRTISHLYPPDCGSAFDQVLANSALAGLKAQGDAARQNAVLYRAHLNELRARYPQFARHNWPMVQDAMKAFDHFTWPLGELMQHLPGDITNHTSLSAEEVRMCESASVLADYTHHLLLNGLEAVTQLLALAGQQKPDALPALGRLTQYLTEESRFMAQNAAEYGMAAQNLRRR